MYSLNWDPICSAHATKLAAMSIRNLVSFLRIGHGVKPETVQFTRPEDPSVFGAPWASNFGASRMSVEDHIDAEDIRPFSAQDIRDALAEQARKGRSGGPCDGS